MKPRQRIEWDDWIARITPLAPSDLAHCPVSVILNVDAELTALRAASSAARRALEYQRDFVADLADASTAWIKHEIETLEIERHPAPWSKRNISTEQFLKIRDRIEAGSRAITETEEVRDAALAAIAKALPDATPTADAGYTYQRKMHKEDLTLTEVAETLSTFREET